MNNDDGLVIRVSTDRTAFVQLYRRHYDAIERLILLKEAMPALKPRYQTIITLRFFENLKLTEIAEILGSSPGTVRSQLARALVKLREKMSSGCTARPAGGI